MRRDTKFESIEPVRPASAYQGGKSQLAKTIIMRIDTVPHTTYAEPFVGMGGVFFRRGLRPKAEAINDLSGDIANLFRILQRHYPQFMDCLKFQIASRREFERLKVTDPATLTDLERAARFLYLQKSTFGGKVAARTFGIDPTGPARFNINRLGPVLEDLHDRLAGVMVENLPWADFIKRYDRKATLFYLDPPYWGCEADYGPGLFSPDDFGHMAGVLKALKGRFILSLNDVPEVRQMFGRFQIEPVKLTYTISGGVGKAAREVIISNCNSE